MTKFITLSSLILVGSLSLNAQAPFSYPSGCNAPATNLGTPPRLTGAAEFDGMLPSAAGATGYYVGVFNASDELIGQGQIGTIINGMSTSEGFIIPLQTDEQSNNCPVFTDGDEITIKLRAGSEDLLAGNSIFTATVADMASGRIDGPNGMVGVTDTFDFLSNALPVTLADFSASPNRNQVDLSWSTSSETENSYFEVQRSTSLNGDFQNIGKVLGNETTSAFNTYGFTDNNPAEGTNYYRLQQFDLDGSSNFSPIVTADMEVSAERSVSVYPNPTAAGSRMTVRLNGNWTAGGASLELVDANGRKVADWTGLSNGSLNTELPVVKAGVYQLIATDGKERKVTRVIVR
ncbi:T9SS type A sorting domain-containing protein [Neolewinella aurantiaca]|uniref:T9SS type A sorting domain-containing protein n=1 Tax=Neolewinella aurantiaca TaxID=2602767 RepID=A0A5C7FDW3_9BACT|nr:T9SS type A sorting domain-containing protein [Neolewinella aurantiaca]TXF88879.1 T9SS type A sorting domain-containing protein [Neolewinella aurantiaca]